MSTSIGVGSVHAKVTGQKLKDGKEKELLEGGRMRPSTGAGAIPVADFHSPLLVNYDQIKKAERDFTEREMLSPIVRTVRHKGRNIVALKLYSDDEWGAVWEGSHCGFCDHIYSESVYPHWVQTDKPQLCKICNNPRGRDAIASSPIWFGPISSIDTSQEEYVDHAGTESSVSARRSERQSLYRHHAS